MTKGAAIRTNSGTYRLESGISCEPAIAYFHEVDKRGHLAAWEQPELFAAELRAAFGPSP